jgi:hypothetical protein
VVVCGDGWGWGVTPVKTVQRVLAMALAWQGRGRVVIGQGGWGRIPEFVGGWPIDGWRKMGRDGRGWMRQGRWRLG